MVSKIKPQARISAAEAEKAIYVDCEGFVDKPPALIGILEGEILEQVVLDPVLKPVAEGRGHRFSNLSTEVSRLVKKCKSQGVFIVSFTQHERNLFFEYANVDVDNYYKDAHKIAKRWISLRYPGEPPRGRALKDYLDFINYPNPKYLGLKKSTKRISGVREMIKIRKTYEALTPVKKAQWTKLLQHNEIDCRGMKTLVQRASNELE